MKVADVPALKVDGRSWHCDPDLGFQGLARASFDEPTAEKHTPPRDRVNLFFVAKSRMLPFDRADPPPTASADLQVRTVGPLIK